MVSVADFGSDLDDDDKVNLEKMQTRLNEDKELRKVQISDNTETNKRSVFDKTVDRILQGLVDDSLDFHNKLSESERNKYVKSVLYKNCFGQVSVGTLRE